MNIGKYKIGCKYEPFIIAEMSGNHNQSIERAFSIIEAAKKSGANALKIQTYTAETMTLPIKSKRFTVNDKDNIWEGENLYNLYQKAYTPWEWHERIFKKAKELNLICFSTPFDETAVDFLEGLDVPAYKIASFEITHLPLIIKIAKTKKPMIISTGMATLAEIDECVTAAKQSGCKDLILLKCTSTYPANPKNSNLNTIPHLKKLFKCEVGLSDHTMGIGSAISAVSLGASVIEKHFTLRRSDGGVDASFSMEPNEMEQLVYEVKNAWQSLGKIKYGPSKDEIKSKKFRRSIYAKKDIEKGSKFSEKNIGIFRPSGGIPPKYYSTIIGKKVEKKILKGTPITWKIL